MATRKKAAAKKAAAKKVAAKKVVKKQAAPPAKEAAKKAVSKAPAKAVKKAAAKRAAKKAPSNKTAAKKTPAKKTAVEKVAPRGGKARLVETVVVPSEDVSEFVTPEVKTAIAAAQRVLGTAGNMSVAQILGNIRQYADHAAAHVAGTRSSGCLALICGWTCGKLLLAAKNSLDHGKFGKWLDEAVVSDRISQRTAHRYMQLAEGCTDVTALLELRSLRQAYLACGILPAPATGGGQRNRGQLVTTDMLLTSVASLQKSLRRFDKDKITLAEDDRGQLAMLRDQIIEFFNTILG